MIGIDIAKGNNSVVGSAIKDLSMTSRANSLKIHSESNWSANVYPDVILPPIEITHNLGYVPAFRVYGQAYDYPDGVNRIKVLLETPFNSVGEVSIYSYATTTKLYINIMCGYDTPIETILGHYIIFKDSV